MRDPEASDFCYYPFFQVLVSAEGQYKPCSKHADFITHNGKVLTTANATLKEAWESEYMQRIRKSMNENKQFPGCSECWRMQKMGLRSMRYHSYQYKIPESQVLQPESPMRIEINSSNVCNLRCRICFATASTKWLQEAIDLYDFKEKVHLNLHAENLEQVKNWAGNLVELALFGGEPLLSEENLQLLDYLIENDYAGNISLLFNTNATVFDDSIRKKLRAFKKVRIHFSIDDLFDRFEYQRKGATWVQVEENLKLAYDMMMELGSEKFDLKICNSISLFNIYYMPEFFAWFGEHFPGLIIYFNYIYDPSRFNIQILPPELKQLLAERLKTIEYNFDYSGEDGELIGDLLTYMDHDVEMSFGEFFRLVNRHDVYRKESFEDVFPEFYALIEKYKPQDLDMGVGEHSVEVRTGKWLDSIEFENELSSAIGEIKSSDVEILNESELHRLAYMSIFEQRKKSTETIHIGAMYSAFVDKLYKTGYLSEMPESPAAWLKTYLDQVQEYNKFKKYRGLNGSLDNNINWLTETADQNSGSDRIFTDIIKDPVKKLLKDLSAFSTDALKAHVVERYS